MIIVVTGLVSCILVYLHAIYIAHVVKMMSLAKQNLLSGWSKLTLRPQLDEGGSVGVFFDETIRTASLAKIYDAPLHTVVVPTIHL